MHLLLRPRLLEESYEVMLDQEAGNTLFKHVLEIRVNPEIESRIRNGMISEQFQLYAAQIVSYTDGRRNVISRLEYSFYKSDETISSFLS
jgi:hypothetical protein